MASEKLAPSGTHDDLPVGELEQEVLHTSRFLEASARGEMMLLQVGILGKLAQHGALSEGGGWAAFHTDQFAGEGSLAYASRKDVLVFAAQLTNETVPKYRLRVVTNEIVTPEIVMPDSMSTPQIFTQDFGISEFGRARYNVSAAETAIDEEGSMTINLGKSSSAIFTKMFEGLFFTTGSYADSYVPVVRLGQKPDEGIYQHGVAANHSDTLYALEMGRSMFALIGALEPAYQHSPKQSETPS